MKKKTYIICKNPSHGRILGESYCRICNASEARKKTIKEMGEEE